MSTPVEPTAPDLAAEEQEALDELRKLLFGEQRTEIVSQALPQAIELRHRQDDSLVEALEPIVEDSLERSIRTNLSSIAEALYPVIGPAIRRAIAAAFQNLILSMNQVIDHNFTARGLKWRVEAWRSGCSVAEVALRHSLVYRVEQVFLIHRETGLPLLHVAQAGQEGNEALVAGMLTAIQDFVRDSFQAEAGEELDVVQVGELTIWIERGPHAVLAAVVRGTAPPTLRGDLQEIGESLHARRKSALSTFEGDAAPLEAERPQLEGLLAEQHREGERAPFKAIAVLIVLALVGAWFGGRSLIERSRRAALLEALRAEPGIVVVSGREEAGTYVVRGLRDPLAADPTDLRAASKLGPGEVRFELARYHAFEPKLVLARAQKVLRPPRGLRLTLRSGQLVAEGSAPTKWIRRARTLAITLPGVSDYIDAAVIDDDKAEADTLCATAERVELKFARGSAALLPGQAAGRDTLAASLRNLAAKRLVVEVVLLIELGPAGSTQRALAEARWAALRRHLLRAGVPAAVLESTRLEHTRLGDICRLRVHSRSA